MNLYQVERNSTFKQQTIGTGVTLGNILFPSGKLKRLLFYSLNELNVNRTQKNLAVRCIREGLSGHNSCV